MLFLKYVLMTGGVGLILMALGILAYDLTMEMRYRRALAVEGSGPLPAIPKLRWRNCGCGSDASVGTDTGGFEHRRDPQRHGGSSSEPDARNVGRNAVPRHRVCGSVVRESRAVRYARPVVHDGVNMRMGGPRPGYW